MTPDEVQRAVDLLAEYESLKSICEELQKSHFSLEVGSCDVLEAINFNAEAMMRMAKPIWLEVRQVAHGVLEALSQLQVDVSEQRKHFEESVEWRPSAWNS